MPTAWPQFLMRERPRHYTAQSDATLDAVVLSRSLSQKFVTFMARLNKEDLNIMCELMEAGKVTPVIDRLYRLNKVPEAVRYLAERHARGKVVITTIVGGIPL